MTDVWAVISDCDGWRYRIGSRDCCTFIAHFIKRTTGRDLLKEFPRYRRPCEAERIIANSGGWAGMFDKVLPRIPVLQASRGDVVLMTDEPGICVGTAVAVFTTDSKIAYRPMTLATEAWRNG